MNRMGSEAAPARDVDVQRQQFNSSTPANTAQITRASHLSRDVLLPLILVMTTFAVMGFVGGMGEVLIKHFQDILQLSKTESAGLQASASSAYIIGPLTASGWLVRRHGYRMSIIIGFAILATGCILFWPAGHFQSFGGFCGCAFLIGSGFALLDCAAIPYISSLGPSNASEIRVNIALAIQSVFAVSALTLSSYVILGPAEENANISVAKGLAPVQWLYLGLGSFAFVMSIVFWFVPLPEIDDITLNEQMELEQENSGWTDKPLRRQTTLWLAFGACCCFVGAHAAIGAFFINLAMEMKPSLTAPAAARQLAIAHGIFAVARFAASGLMKWVRPRLLLLGSMGLTLAFLAAVMGTSGTAGIVMMTLEFICKAPIHPTIVSLALRGLGRHTKRGAAILVTALASGIFFAPATGAIADRLNTQLALCVPLTGVVLAFAFPVYINIFKGKELDALRQSSLAIQPRQTRRDVREESAASGSTSMTVLSTMEQGSEDLGRERSETVVSRYSKPKRAWWLD